jgi:subtilisin-like proprotein convertase family protein
VQDVIIRGGATLSPGPSPGIITLNNLMMSNNANLFLKVNGLTPGTQCDQVVAKTSVNISNAILSLAVAYPPAAGDIIRIVDNQGSGPVLGTFNGRPQGSIISEGGNQFVISYTGGTGNDITLALTNARLELEIAYIPSGNGLVDAGECNELYVVLRNQSGSTLTGVTAQLDSLSPNIAVTQQGATYPGFAIGSTRTNQTPFRISSLPGFACGQRVELRLTVNIPGSSAFAIPVILTTGLPGSVYTYSSSTSAAIPDLGTTNSAINVTGFPGYVGKATVSVFINHTYTSDLDIYLQSPSGRLVMLATDCGGAGDNYGTNCSPSTARTTFDDASRNTIVAGAAPFQGTFSPEEALANMQGESGNGTWRLIITDDAGGDAGALNCWTLNLSAADCAADAASACTPCVDEYVGRLNSLSPTMPQRIFRDWTPSVCGDSKPFPGVSEAAGPFRYAAYTFTNTGASGCMTVVLEDSCGNQSLFATAYQGSFNPANLGQNYLADTGTNALASTMSFYVLSNGVFTVTVSELIPLGSCPTYFLKVFGLPCPPPTLNIAPAAADKVRLHWNALGGDGYLVQSAPTLNGTYTNVNSTPVYLNGTLNITNSTGAAQQYFRLRKP